VDLGKSKTLATDKVKEPFDGGKRIRQEVGGLQRHLERQFCAAYKNVLGRPMTIQVVFLL
jgi:hypothetical protein